MDSHQLPGTLITSDNILIVLVHGFLDTSSTWNEVSKQLSDGRWTTIAADLLHHEVDAPSSGTLEAYASQVLAAVAAGSHPGLRGIVIIGHSMGAQVAELAAVGLQDRIPVTAIFIAPAPLAGYRLSDDEARMFAAAVENKDPQRLAVERRMLMPRAAQSVVESAIESALTTSEDFGREQLKVWVGGHQLGQEPSLLRSQVLIIGSEHDPVFTIGSLERNVVPRFQDPLFVVIPYVGHWPHLEAPSAIADLIAQKANELISRLNHMK